MGRLGRMRVAAIVADGFEQSELDGPVEALRAAGVTVDVLAPDAAHHDHVASKNGAGVKPDRLLDDANPDTYDALLIPGGDGPALMRRSPRHLGWVQRVAARDVPIAAICHGAWLVADAGIAAGRTMTSYPGIRADIEAAGARWVDREVVVDGKLVTSRKPEDVPAFSKALLALLEDEYEKLANPHISENGGGLEIRPSAVSIA